VIAGGAGLKPALGIALIVAAALAPATSAAAPTPPPERGIALGLFAEEPAFSYAKMLQEIAATGATHVSLVMPMYQHNVRSSTIRRHPRFSPPDAAVRRAMALARGQGLKVLLFPILRLEYSLTVDEWRGNLRPRDPDRWWRSYRAMMLRAARLARAGKAESLCVGSELSSMDGEVARWRALIRDVRKVFRGQLLYSANWDRYRDVAIWGLVDRVGLSAYFQLISAGEQPSLARLVHAWREFKVQVERLRARVGKELVITEVGYHSQAGAAARPWEESATAALALELQARCYRAFRRVWAGARGLRGVYFWNWFGYGGPRSREYSPRGKPAAREICSWYGAAPERCPTRYGAP